MLTEFFTISSCFKNLGVFYQSADFLFNIVCSYSFNLIGFGGFQDGIGWIGFRVVLLYCLGHHHSFLLFSIPHLPLTVSTTHYATSTAPACAAVRAHLLPPHLLLVLCLLLRSTALPRAALHAHAHTRTTARDDTTHTAAHAACTRAPILHWFWTTRTRWVAGGFAARIDAVGRQFGLSSSTRHNGSRCMDKFTLVFFYVGRWRCSGRRDVWFR
jgi:hypothetical protein